MRATLIAHSALCLEFLRKIGAKKTKINWHFDGELDEILFDLCAGILIAGRCFVHHDHDSLRSTEISIQIGMR